MRKLDRVESALLLGALLLAVVLIPVAVLLGNQSYAASQARVAEQQAARHSVTATVREAVPIAALPAQTAGQVEVTAVWKGGSTTVAAQPGARPGDKVQLWLDRQNHPVPAPLTMATAGTDAVLAGVCAWLAMAGLVWAAFVLVRWRLDRARSNRWTQDWWYFESARHTP